jgi:2-deoxy-D-gluconate 3-dehydrogenase
MSSSQVPPEVCTYFIQILFPTNKYTGIGAACAIALAEAGASICLVLRQSPEGASPNLATLTAIQALSVKVQVIYCDLGDLDAVKGVFQKALDIMGGQIDVLVNCAGIQRRNPSVDFSENDWDDVSSVRPHLMLIIHWNANK